MFACIEQSFSLLSHTPPATERHATRILWTGPEQYLLRGNVLRRSEKLTSDISSTKPENMAKIGPVDVEITDMTEIVKIKSKYKTKSEHKPTFGCCIVAEPDRLITGQTSVQWPPPAI